MATVRLTFNASSVFFVYMNPQRKLGAPIQTRVEEWVEERLRKDAEEQDRTLADIMRLILTFDAKRRKKGT